ncbi:hypothetical protein [Streptomyces xantholiticus]|uniref:hypothetical protein n=1 Tax=Streptomyces xantholiticus TaxID=68285 RepID=UPI0016785E66|nr:hypothetical protein [Streptomyces xantholiticus]GGW29703.1 hypothetical protein GCM10010381_12890 [Streptomyces xantholiticus]
MRTGSIAFRVAGAAAVLVMAPATAAFAGSSVKATVTPAAVAPGGEVEIRVVGCRAGSGVARSDAFRGEAALSAKGRHGLLVGRATVGSRVKPGTYDVRVGCDLREHPGAGSVEVTRHHHSKAAPPDPAPSKKSRHDEPRERHPSPPQTHESPVAPVRAGGGGTAVLAAPVSTVDAEDGGPSTSQTVIGLVLAGVAAVAVAVRSTRRRRRTGTD